jgi:hypothetical protein
MAGIQKTCRTCKELFITRSSNSARWETQCYECFNQHKKTKQMINFQEREENIVKNLENRLIKTEEWMDNIPSVIGAEVNNIMNQIINEELLSDIEKKNTVKIESLTSELLDRLDNFEEKIQRQISLLNTRIVKIMKEMD